MNKEFLNKGPIKPEKIAAYIADAGNLKDSGGHSIFLGQVRNDSDGNKTVTAIEYSAYEEMVATEAARIIKLTGDAFPDVKDIIILHSTGLVQAGEISLFVMVTAGHRDQATRACRHVVEMIKLNYPVWKKELFDDNSEQWRDNENH